MIGHQDEIEHLPCGLGDDSFEVGEDAEAVLVIVEDVLASIATGHDVVDGVRVLDAKSSWHERKHSRAGSSKRGRKPNTKSDPKGFHQSDPKGFQGFPQGLPQLRGCLVSVGNTIGAPGPPPSGGQTKTSRLVTP